jgi:hypothetical protein
VKFDKHKAPGALAAKAPSRYAIHNGVTIVEHDGGTFIAATDGRALTLIRATLDDTDTPNGVYPVAAFAAARKAANHMPKATVGLNGSARVEADGAATEFAKVDGRFPDVLSVVPTGEPKQVLRLHGDRLARIQKALGANAVEIHIHGRDMPWVIVPIYTEGPGTDDGSFGVLSPIDPLDDLPLRPTHEPDLEGAP